MFDPYWRNFGWIVVAAVILLVVLVALGRVFATALGARTREAHYRVLAESGSDVVWLYDLDTQRFTYISPAVERMRGYTVAEAMRRAFADRAVMHMTISEGRKRQVKRMFSAMVRSS